MALLPLVYPKLTDSLLDQLSSLEPNVLNTMVLMEVIGRLYVFTNNGYLVLM